MQGSGVYDWHGLVYYYDPNNYNYTLNGKKFAEVQQSLANQLLMGEATINKYHLVVGDTWMLNNDTIFTPILRMDHSSLFGTNITANFGITHNLGGNLHRRFKANIGTAVAPSIRIVHVSAGTGPVIRI